jgi:oxygen-dependent protoporphyrinogen oxidase
MFFNHANVLRGAGKPRRPGGALMISAAAGPAAELLSKSDSQIEAIFTRDLLEVFPAAKGQLREIMVQRWEYGAPYAKPGRAQLQGLLQEGDGRLLLAGDYAGAWVSMESAAQTGQAAAQRLDLLLGPSSHD